MDMVGKFVASIIRTRLQNLAEEVLPESQCGFRGSKSCTDMIFTVRQLLEKSWEHNAKSFFNFCRSKKGV